MDPYTEDLVLLLAEQGRVKVAQGVLGTSWRKLWYRGLTKYVSPTEMSLSDYGAREANRLLYHSSR